MKKVVLRAFLEVRSGVSADALIADPDLNARFISRCIALGATESAFDLNHCLYNLRKVRALEDFPTTKRRRLTNQDEYRFAVEIAVRFLERRHSTTLDRIICDPALATEFDKLAREVAPGYSSFEYRFTALSLRKKSGLKPELVSRILPFVQVKIFRAVDLHLEDIPKNQGVYVFFYKQHGVLYVGEAEILRSRIGKHLEHSDRKELARWLWDHGAEDLFIEIHALPEGTTAMARKALERELINSRKPRFNISGFGSKGL